MWVVCARAMPQRGHCACFTRTTLQAPPAAPAASPADEAELNRLLDKINEAGIDGLSRSEKDRLNELSKKLRGR